MKPRIILLITFTLVFCLFLVMPAISAGLDQGKPVTLDVKDNDIRDILAGLAKANGINLVMGNSVQGRINITLSNMPFLKAIELIAKSSGFAVEIVDNTIIVAKPENIKELLPKISKVISLQYTSAAELKQTLTGVALEGVEIVADQRTNSIFVTGLESSIQKLDEIVKLLDVPSEPTKIPVTTKIFTLEHARAASIQQTISNFCSPVGKINIDERTNSLIITDQPASFDKISEIIGKLDVLTKDEEDKLKAEKAKAEVPPPQILPPPITQVYNLNYVEASALKPTIQSILSASGKVESFIKRRDIVTVETGGGGSGGSGGSGGGDQSGGGGGPAGVANFYKEKWSDTIIVTDTPDIIDQVTALIAKLDKKTPQVRIEAKMVDVELTSEEQLGINWSGTHKSSGSTASGTFANPIVSGVDINLGSLSTEHFEDIMLKIQALEARGLARLVSNPSVIAMDNELAQMIIADRIPLESSFVTPTGVISKQVTYINVGVSLNVVPHITEDGYILLDAMPSIESAKGTDNPPTILSRMSHCRVRVKDGETFVIAGLVRDEQSQDSTHVPFLGRIPLIGRLFGYTSKTNKKTDLVIFITPKIIKDDTK